MWENFTTYFNTYFNASKAFEQAQEQLQKNKKELFQFKVDKLDGTTQKQLDLVVEKCSRILQFDSKSSYVAGSLFMLGRTFYFKSEFPKAARKFKELAVLNDDEYSLRNLLWIGKTELQLRNFNSGLAILDSVKTDAAAEENEDVLVKAYNAQISYFIFDEDYEIAVNLIKELTNVSENDELNAEATYELGKIYLKLDSLKDAANAFVLVADYSPSFETDFNSKLEYATIKRKLGNIDESLSILEDMESQNKYSKKRDKIELQIANIFRDRGNIDDAISKYMEIDSTYKRTESAGYASYNIARILQDSLGLYDSAMVYYKKTLSSSVPREFKNRVRRGTNVLSKYLDLSEQQLKYEKKLNYILNPEVFVQDSLDYEFYMGHDTSTVSRGNIKDSTKVDSVSNNKNKVNNKPQQNNFLTDFQNQNKIKIKKPVRPRISADSAKHTLSKIRYNLGNLFLGDLVVADSAFFYYKLILQDDPEGPFTAKTLFALGSFYSSQNDSASADSLFKIVYDNYKNFPIAVEAARRLGHAEANSSSDGTKQMYVDAENTYMSGNYTEAIAKFYDIANNYPKSPMAPKSLYAIGWLLERKLDKPDSAFSVFSRLHKKYRRSEYTLAITPQINAYNRELKRKEKALRDSLNKIKRDSIALVKKKSLESKEIKDVINPKVKNNKDSVKTIGKSLIDAERALIKKGKGKKRSVKRKMPDFKKFPIERPKKTLKKDTTHTIDSK